MTPCSCAPCSRGVATAAYEIDWVRSFEQARAAIEHPAHDACLLDYRLGGHDGLELLRRARECGYPLPIIVLTGHGEHEVDEEALAAGAADFLTKQGITGSALDRSLRYAISHRQALEALRASERERRRLSVELLAAQENERRSVARDIHDSIGQTLAAAKYVLESMLEQRAGALVLANETMIARVVEHAARGHRRNRAPAGGIAAGDARQRGDRPHPRLVLRELREALSGHPRAGSDRRSARRRSPIR